MAESPKSQPLLSVALRAHSQKLTDAVVRTSHLRTRADGSVDAHWMLEALQELDTAHAELQVAEEELQSKADELQSSQRALQLERQAYRDLFEAAPDAYLVTDRFGVIQQANLRASQLLHVAPAYLTGKPLAVFSSETDRRVLCDMLSLLSATRPTTFELTLTPRKATRPLRTVASVVQGADGRLRWIFREQRALTEPSAPLREAGAPDEVERLTRELDEERRRRALAERQVEARNRRLAYVSHELRNPLLALSGWLEMLQEECDARGRAEIVEVLLGNVRVMSVLVDELVDKTRVDESLIKLSLQDVDLGDMLQRLCDEFSVIARGRELELTASVDPSVGRMRCDPLRIRQVLVNLLDNASKFTSPRGRIELHAQASERWIEISVRDDGRGIEQSKLGQIFEPFMRVAADEVGGGLGLGLNIAQRLVELHHGSIVAESAGLGSGATFRVRLPR